MGGKALLKAIGGRWILRVIRRCNAIVRGNVFANPGPITEDDFRTLKRGVDEVKPRIFLELGTGRGISTTKLFGYLSQRYPTCHFYTIDAFKPFTDTVQSKYLEDPTFHAIHGLTLTREETTPPAYNELFYYSGPVNVLRNLLQSELKGQPIDIAFIDSRKGTALAEFMFLEGHLSRHGLIFCHDVLNQGKGVEVLAHLRANEGKYLFEVIDTGPAGMIKAKLRQQ